MYLGVVLQKMHLSLRSVPTERSRLRLQQYLAKRDNIHTERSRSHFSDHDRCLGGSGVLRSVRCKPYTFPNFRFFCTKMVPKHLAHPILAVPNFLQSFCTKMVCKKFGMPNFGHSEFLPIFLHQNGWEKFGTPNFGHSKFLALFLYQNGLKKFRMPHFGHSKFLLVFLTPKWFKKNSEHPILAIPNFFQSFCTKMVGKKFGMVNFWKFEIAKIGHSIFSNHFGA